MSAAGVKRQLEKRSKTKDWKLELLGLLSPTEFTHEFIVNDEVLVDFIQQLLDEEFEKGIIKGRLEALPITKQLLDEKGKEAFDNGMRSGGSAMEELLEIWLKTNFGEIAVSEWDTFVKKVVNLDNGIKELKSTLK